MEYEKGDGYFACNREDILSLLNLRDGIKVLDVGCGYGGAGKLIKAKYKAEVHGIDISPIAVEKARIHYDSAISANIELYELLFEAKHFDFIICSDVLEHLSDPWNVLRKLKNYLKDDGQFAASIPNFRNADVLVQLIDGSFDYQQYGVLDDTHLRFFTYHSSIRLFERSGFKVTKIIRKIVTSDSDQIIDVWKHSRMSHTAAMLIKKIAGKDITLGDDFLEDLLTLQFLITAGKQEQRNG
jgi:2-polyprenyl-3-methyl-5-hydroxy-6-metoxy-1,4-benzoquinol methylase